MAFSTKISFVPRDAGEKSMSFDMVDYGLDNGSVLNVKDSFNSKLLNYREINNYYFDFVSVLTIEEFLEFHKIHCKHGDREKVLNQFLSKDIKTVQYSWVIIEVYEWESGLDE